MADACSAAAECNFDAIEIFAPAADAVSPNELNPLLQEYGLAVAAVGTGAGMVKHGLSLTDPCETRRCQASDFIRSIIDMGGQWHAPAIIGSMQGRWGGDVSRDQALDWLAEALNELGPYAARHGVPLIYEPLNRYETNLITTMAEGAAFLQSLATDNVKLLGDLFHMNIEEADLGDAIRAAGAHLGHVHFVDSNRRAAGLGHLDFTPVVAALREIGYEGYLSAEALPLPDSDTAARMTAQSFQKLFS